jgi:hypothetical protein
MAILTPQEVRIECAKYAVEHGFVADNPQMRELMDAIKNNKPINMEKIDGHGCDHLDPTLRSCESDIPSLTSAPVSLRHPQPDEKARRK